LAKSLTIAFIASHLLPMVWVARSTTRASASGSLFRSLWRSRSAESWIGVSGFLISWARRRATSPQAASRWARISVVMSSNTTTCPLPRRRVGQRAAAAHQHLAAVAAEQRDLFAPLGAGGDMPAHRLAPVQSRGWACSSASSECAPSRSNSGRPQDLRAAGLMVPRFSLVEGDDAAGQPAEHGLEVGALLLHRALAARRLIARLGDAAGHRVERRDQERQLVVLRGSGSRCS
jgi:hypothetical protein